jgi:hypothetical protein
VWRLHRDRCKGNENAVQERQEERRSPVGIDDIEVIDDMRKVELIALADDMGIEIDKRWTKAHIADAIHEAAR